MNIRKIESEWAWSRIEVMADNELSEAESDRMRKALTDDPELAAAFSRARSMRETLAAMSMDRPPRGLLRQLLSISTRDRRASSWYLAPAGALAVAVIAVIFAISVPRQTPDPETEAVRDFVLAMAYVHETALTTRSVVGERVSLGIAEALTMTRDSLSREGRSGNENGD